MTHSAGHPAAAAGRRCGGAPVVGDSGAGCLPVYAARGGARGRLRCRGAARDVAGPQGGGAEEAEGRKVLFAVLFVAVSKCVCVCLYP
jgi:hypothetical protein